jgi:hypothetical protein
MANAITTSSYPMPVWCAVTYRQPQAQLNKVLGNHTQPAGRPAGRSGANDGAFEFLYVVADLLLLERDTLDI